VNLHESSSLFLELVRAAAEYKNIPEHYVEKDYWITRGLKFLSHSPYHRSVVFKGGTSLSKAYGILDRFSEDIDLAIRNDEKRGNSKSKTLMKKIEKTVSQDLTYIPKHEKESKHGRFRKTIFEFPANIKSEYYEQGSNVILLEINSFADPNPVDIKPISSIIEEYCKRSGKQEFVDQFLLEQFSINVLAVERTLCEKIMRLIRASYGGDPIANLRGCIRHFYDIVIILRMPKYRQFLGEKSFGYMMNEVHISDRKLFPNQASEWLDFPMENSKIFSENRRLWNNLSLELQGGFKDMIYSEDVPELEEFAETFSFIRHSLPRS